MNLKISKQSLIALFLATVFSVAFNWQFTYIYTFIIEYSKEVKLSTLYTHLFIYSFLVFTLFLFLMNLVNFFFKSKVFITTIVLSLFLFYISSHIIYLDSIKYFLNYSNSDEESMFIILFIISTLVYGIYSLIVTLIQKRVPMFHSLVFMIFALAYSAWFIDTHAYPINELPQQIESLINKSL